MIVLPLAGRLDAIADRLQKMEVQVRSLVTIRVVEAREFLLRDERGEIRARLEIAEYSPRLTFYDRLGKARLRVIRDVAKYDKLPRVRGWRVERTARDGPREKTNADPQSRIGPHLLKVPSTENWGC